MMVFRRTVLVSAILCSVVLLAFPALGLAAIDQDQVDVDARTLHEAMYGALTDKDAVFGVLEHRNPEELRAIKDTFKLRYGSYWPPEGSLEGALKDDLSDWGRDDLSRALRALDRALPPALPVTAAPTAGPMCSAGAPSLWPAGYWGSAPPLLPCGLPGQEPCLECGFCGLLVFAQRIIYFMMTLVIFIIAPVRFIWGGFLILVSQGSPEKVGHGRGMIMHTVIGLVVALGAFLMVQTFLWLLGNPAGVGWPNVTCPWSPF